MNRQRIERAAVWAVLVAALTRMDLVFEKKNRARTIARNHDQHVGLFERAGTVRPRLLAPDLQIGTGRDQFFAQRVERQRPRERSQSRQSRRVTSTGVEQV